MISTIFSTVSFALLLIFFKISLLFSFVPVIIEYELIDHMSPQNNIVRYRLEGWDNAWIDDTKKNFRAIYSRLSPGNYTFQIEGNNGFTASSVLVNIPFEIIPPFWQTWWFIALCILIPIGIMYGFYRYRINQIYKIQSVRNKIALDLHDEVGSSLSSIRMLSEIAGTNENNKEILKKISNNANETVEKMGDIIWMINPKYDQLENIKVRMAKFIYEICSAKNILYELNAEFADKLKLNMQQRKNLLLIFKEGVNNAAKYSKAEKITVSISHANHCLNMIISDNGKGFDINNVKPGNGLDNMKIRTEELKGEINIKSQINTGTEINVSIQV